MIYKPVDGKIELNNCSLKTLVGLRSEDKLEFLYARSNLLEEIPIILEFNHLKILDLSSNNLKSLKFLSQMPFIKVSLFCSIL
jgi:Leucine-rich repeat (LRR) protein